jgi:hypothetical protein
MDPSTFVPVYDDGVTESLPGHPELGTWNISKYYCLSPESADTLASFFDPAPEVVQLPPIPQHPGSPFAFNHDVPWLNFADGTQRNAGQLAIYWGMPGVSDPLAEAKIDIATPVQGQ